MTEPQTAAGRTLPRLEVREYAERRGAFYMAVGEHGRWLIDDVDEARLIADAYNGRAEAAAAARAEERKRINEAFEDEDYAVGGVWGDYGQIVWRSDDVMAVVNETDAPREYHLGSNYAATMRDCKESLEAIEAERDALAAENAALRDIDPYQDVHDTGWPTCLWCNARPPKHEADCAWGNPAAAQEWLREHDAEVVRLAADEIAASIRARFLDLDSPDAEQRLLFAVRKADSDGVLAIIGIDHGQDEHGHPLRSDYTEAPAEAARAILAALRQPASSQPEGSVADHVFGDVGQG